MQREPINRRTVAARLARRRDKSAQRARQQLAAQLQRAHEALKRDMFDLLAQAGAIRG